MVAAFTLFGPTIGGLATSIHFSYELPYYLSFYLRTYWLLVPFIFIALWDATSPYRTALRWLGAALLIYLVPLSFFTDVVQYRYLFMLTPALFILAAAGVVSAIRYLPRIWCGAAYALIAVLFLTIGGGVAWPRGAYFLEADNPASVGDRPHYAYTPQPDWKAAYAYIAANRGADDLIISSLPTMTRIYLDEPGLWLAHDYMGAGDAARWIANGREQYVGAVPILTTHDLRQLTEQHHGFLVLDYQAADNVPEDILQYITEHMTVAFQKETNAYSQVWVYKF
jgi:hypothetical protein